MYRRNANVGYNTSILGFQRAVFKRNARKRVETRRFRSFHSLPVHPGAYTYESGGGWLEPFGWGILMAFDVQRIQRAENAAIRSLRKLSVRALQRSVTNCTPRGPGKQRSTLVERCWNLWLAEMVGGIKPIFDGLHATGLELGVHHAAVWTYSALLGIVNRHWYGNKHVVNNWIAGICLDYQDFDAWMRSRGTSTFTPWVLHGELRSAVVKELGRLHHLATVPGEWVTSEMHGRDSDTALPKLTDLIGLKPRRKGNASAIRKVGIPLQDIIRAARSAVKRKNSMQLAAEYRRFELMGGDPAMLEQYIYETKELKSWVSLASAAIIHLFCNELSEQTILRYLRVVRKPKRNPKQLKLLSGK